MAHQHVARAAMSQASAPSMQRLEAALKQSTTHALYRELTAPTAIDHSLTAHFTAPTDSNLVLARGNVLEILTVTDAGTLVRRLELKLSGTVCSMASVRLDGCSRDSLILAFQPCKTAIVHYDPSTNDIITLDTAHFDGLSDSLSSLARNTVAPSAPIIRVDPLYRCATVLAFASHLVVLPLGEWQVAAVAIEHRDHVVDAYYYKAPGAIVRPYVIALSSLAIKNVTDYVFLSGYYSPTLLLMHEAPYTWEGRYAVNRHTQRLLTVTLELSTQSFSIIGPTSLPLPHDADTLVALPSPHDGALIFSSHLLFHFYNQHIDYVLSTNIFGDTDSRYNSDHSGLVCHLLVSAVTVLQSQNHIEVLVGLKDGQLLVLNIETSGTSIRKLTLLKLAQTAVLSDLTTITTHRHKLVLFASRLGSSLLVEFRARSANEMDEERIEAQRLEEAERIEREERERKRTAMHNELFDTTANVKEETDLFADLGVDDLFNDLFGRHAREAEAKRDAQRQSKRAKARLENTRQYELIVRDLLLNTAPNTDSLVMPSTVDDSDTDSQSPVPVIQMLSISGVASEGSIQYTHSGVVPNIITNFPLEQRCQACFTVFVSERQSVRRNKRRREENGDGVSNSDGESQYHRYLFISTASATLALDTGEEVTQIEATAALLLGDTPSLIIGNLCDNAVIVQVYHSGMRFVYQSAAVIERSAGAVYDGSVSGEPVRILSAQLCDPYLALILSDGSMRIVTVTVNESDGAGEPIVIDVSSPSLSVLADGESGHLIVNAVALYKDRNLRGLFTPRQFTKVHTATGANGTNKDVQSVIDESAPLQPVAAMEEDEVDELELLLAGGSDKTNGIDNGAQPDGLARQSSASSVKFESSTPVNEPIYVCVLCRSHYIELYTLPAFTLIFRAPRLAAGAKFLTHSTEPVNEDNFNVSSVALPGIVEVTIAALSPSADPVLLAYTRQGDLLAYQAFHHSDPLSQSTVLPLRFGRLSVPLTRPAVLKAGRGPQANAAMPDWMYGRRFIPFDNINGRSGLIIGGWRPLIAFGERDSFRCHEFVWTPLEDRSDRVFEDSLSLLEAPESSDERRKQLVHGLACSAIFNNQNCSHGFIFIDIAGFLSIAELPSKPLLPVFTAPSAEAAVTLTRRETLDEAHYDYGLVVRCLPLTHTPRFIAYHQPTNSLSLVLSQRKPIQSIDETTERSLTLYEDTFELLLLSAKNPSVIIGRFDDFDAHEVVTALTTIQIKDKVYIALGTGINIGEEASVRGRVLLLDVYYQQGQESKFLKLRAFAQSEKGPVTSVTSVDSMVVMGVGARLMLYEYDGKNLTGRAFLDCQYYISNIKTVKRFIFLSDLCDALHFAYWDPVVNQILLIGAYHSRRNVSAIDYLIDDRQLSLLITDHDGNIATFKYETKVVPPPVPMPAQIYLTATTSLEEFFKSAQSKRLLAKSDFFADCAVNRILPFKMRSSVTSASLTASVPPTVLPLRSMLLMAALDGRHSLLSVIDEIWHRRLYSLGSQLVHITQPHCALNTRSYRNVSTHSPHLVSHRGIIDGSLIEQYLLLDCDTQLKLARMIGLQADQIVDFMAAQYWQTALQ